MQIRVGLSRWEHDCCGIAYEINDVVTWELFLPYLGTPPSDAEYIEIHHEEILNGVTVTGRVVAIGVMREEQEDSALLRLPSGRALRGFDDNDAGELIDLMSGERIDSEQDDFVVTLDIPGGTRLPTKRARYA